MLFLSNITTQVSFPGNKLNSRLNIKGKARLSINIMLFILGHILKQRVMISTLVKQDNEFSRGLKTTDNEDT